MNKPEGIRNIIDSFSLIVDEAENDFLKLGSYLQNICVNVADLSYQTDNAAKLFQGKDENILEKIKRITNSVQTKLQKSQENIEETIPPIDSIVDLMYKFKIVNGSIDEATKYLRSVAFNFIIESSVISRDDVNFYIIANEVKGLSGSIFEISRKIRKDSEISLIDFNLAKGNISSGLDDLKKLTQNSIKVIDLSIKETEELLTSSFATMEVVSESSQSINNEVVKIIVAIQLHDNINQRVQHINEGLEDILLLIETEEPIGGINYNKEERSGLASLILDIQYSQLNQIIVDVNKVYSENVIAFEGIIEEILSFINALSILEGDKSKGNMILQLLSSLKQLNTLRDQGNKVIEHIKEISSKSSATAEQLSNHVKLVQSISDETKVKALNSIIAADKLGFDGLTLKVLSQEMGVISEKTENFVNDVEKILNGITKSANVLRESSVNEKLDEDETGEKMDDVISSIAEISSEVQENLTLALQNGEKLKTSIGQGIEDLIFFKKITDSFGKSSIKMENLKKSFDPDIDMNKFLENDYFSQRYTMDKERKIHNESIAKNKKNSELEEELREDLGDNIDLF